MGVSPPILAVAPLGFANCEPAIVSAVGSLLLPYDQVYVVSRQGVDLSTFSGPASNVEPNADPNPDPSSLPFPARKFSFK